MGRKRNGYTFWKESLEGRERPKSRRDDNIKVDIKELGVGSCGLDSSDSGLGPMWALVNMVINVHVPLWGMSSAERMSASTIRLCSGGEGAQTERSTANRLICQVDGHFGSIYFQSYLSQYGGTAKQYTMGSSGSIVPDYRLDDRGSIPGRGKGFSL
jgi:hypothetical protein